MEHCDILFDKYCLSGPQNCMVLKVDGYTYRGGSAAITSCCILNKGQLLMESICSSWSRFFPLRVDTILEGLNC